MKALLASILAAALSSATLAATISFPNHPAIPPESDPDSVNVNFVDTGFRFSPSCVLDFLYLGTHRSDNCNNNFLGPALPIPPTEQDLGSLYVDFFGRPFSLISMRTPASGPHVEFHHIDVHSSKGGIVQFFEPTEMFFSGDEWSHISWFVIAARDRASPAQGADNFVVSIPEPATLALMGIALVGLAFSGRRKRSLTRPRVRSSEATL